MEYLVVRWNAETGTYKTLNVRFETYSEAEEYGSNRHQDAEDNARANSTSNRYTRNPYKFLPISADQHARVLDEYGRRIIG